MSIKEKVEDKKGFSVEEKLRALNNLQVVDSKIDKIGILRGELPLEVQDLEDEVAGLETREGNFKKEIVELETIISNKKKEIKESETLLTKYNEQLKNIKNNREYDSLTKEIEFQNLEIELNTKKIKEFFAQIEAKNIIIAEANSKLNDLKISLEEKKNELDSIVKETQKEEEELKLESIQIASTIEDRLLFAYKRIRNNARNGLAVATIERGACGGCYNQIPPQRQLDIKSRRKIIVCEYCGRILVDEKINFSLLEIEQMQNNSVEVEEITKPKRKSRKTESEVE
jgi:predicted  nucleic acid-binding Zn-ribbon protein